jgi:hypothetical protein
MKMVFLQQRVLRNNVMSLICDLVFLGGTASEKRMSPAALKQNTEYRRPL